MRAGGLGDHSIRSYMMDARQERIVNDIGTIDSWF